MYIDITNEVLEKHPQTIMGLMTVYGTHTPADITAWNTIKEKEIALFRTSWPDYDRNQAVKILPLSGYAAYYKQFKKTYPVLLQMESVLLKGRDIMSSSLAVEIMFLAEVKHGLLVAGHNLNKLSSDSYTVRLAQGGEELTNVSGQKRILKADDIFLENGGKILSSILEGQDYDTRLTDESQDALYCVYGVGGVTNEQMTAFFQTLTLYIKTAFPQAIIHDSTLAP